MSWPKLVTHNLGWKLVSVLLATLIWFIARRAAGTAFGTDMVRELADVPVLVVTPADDPRVFRVRPAAARLGIRGPEVVVNRLTPSDIAVFVNLSGTPNPAPGHQPLKVQLPRGLSLSWLDPLEADVEIVPPAPPPSNTNAPSRPKVRP